MALLALGPAPPLLEAQYNVVVVHTQIVVNKHVSLEPCAHSGGVFNYLPL
jgi:hypothetical protein